ncbi:hypothetical protein [Corynebacterium urinipleomorphum]|uniref:hypothetical protein n=1 Tax=Corynebacterium urinipleomorphum TaxID=1852380 RepID=UPI000B34F3D7|nr:hypothetical protein [Corynebacterium urinipleomorphum]
MAKIKLGRGEVVLADMAPPMRGLIFPFLELIIATALSWMLVGWMDASGMDTGIRNAVVCIWFLIVLWRFVLPLIRMRRQRFVVTNKRVIFVPGGRGRTESIPLMQIRGVRRRRGGIDVGVLGYGEAVHFPDVGRAKRVQALIEGQLP